MQTELHAGACAYASWPNKESVTARTTVLWIVLDDLSGAMQPTLACICCNSGMGTGSSQTPSERQSQSQCTGTGSQLQQCILF